MFIINNYKHNIYLLLCNINQNKFYSINNLSCKYLINSTPLFQLVT